MSKLFWGRGFILGGEGQEQNAEKKWLEAVLEIEPDFIDESEGWRMRDVF